MTLSSAMSMKILWLLLGAAIATTSHASPVNTSLQVVASFSIIGDLVQQVGGDRINLVVLAGPGQDAHVYQPNPREVRRITQAQVVFSNGLGFEGWITRLLRSADYKGYHVVLSKDIEPKRDSHSRPHSTARQGSKHHHHGGTDPHAWQDVRNAMVYVRHITDGLCRADPKNCEEYRDRSAQYIAILSRLHEEIRSDWSAIEPSLRKVVTSHDAFAYYAHAYGVEFFAPQGVSTESAPSAKAVGALIQQIRRESIQALFVESISDPRLIEQIARETGLRPSGALYSDSLSTAGGPASTYVEMMRYNTRSLIRAIHDHPAKR
jgi:zinc/manganese transport system substrate-binding protein